jgi:sigma-B regulation protein RsbU (phosphoserine phosphatase)
VLLAYTDGVTEAMDRDGVLYSDERLLAYASSASGQNVRELVAGLMKEIDSYSKGVRSDDTTLLAVKFLG